MGYMMNPKLHAYIDSSSKHMDVHIMLFIWVFSIYKINVDNLASFTYYIFFLLKIVFFLELFTNYQWGYIVKYVRYYCNNWMKSYSRQFKRGWFYLEMNLWMSLLCLYYCCFMSYICVRQLFDRIWVRGGIDSC